MSWSEYHHESETWAAEAEISRRHGKDEHARFCYAQAAEWERKALYEIVSYAERTRSITLLSHVALLIKAGQREEALKTIAQWLPDRQDELPWFAVKDLGEMRDELVCEQSNEP